MKGKFMVDLAASIRAKLLNISKLDKIEFQDFFNRFGAEQFLARLSCSPYLEKFIFKGGSLLTYIIDTERKTRDLDFSIRQISNQVDKAIKIIQEIIDMSMNDALVWKNLEGYPLNHPDMDSPGIRFQCEFYLGVAKGRIQMDLAIGDVVEAKKISLQRIRYKNIPLMGPDFEILAYPPETIFSEKLQIAVSKKGQNTRMKDYYDLLKLSGSTLIDNQILAENIKNTFAKREITTITKLSFDTEDLNRLQMYWSSFLKKMKITDAPKEIFKVIEVINQKLKKIPL